MSEHCPLKDLFIIQLGTAKTQKYWMARCVKISPKVSQMQMVWMILVKRQKLLVGIIGCIKLRVLISVDIAAHNMFFTLDQEIKN